VPGSAELLGASQRDLPRWIYREKPSRRMIPPEQGGENEKL
jgi:hypothetical protein